MELSDIKWCIDYLVRYDKVRLPSGLKDEELFRALQNITLPVDLSEEFYKRQDRVLQGILGKKTVVSVDDMPPVKGKMCLYKGDITLINGDAIVNACNSRMLGCFVPGHHCIDNAIHSFAGLQVRRDMMEIMEEQGHDEPNGCCKVTSGYNLPSKYIFHTVGPVYTGMERDEIDLSNCYLSCLRKADEMHLKNIVFCSLSTGVFGYPIEKAAKIAVETTERYLNDGSGIEKVVYNVFSERDYEVYKGLLG